MWRGGGGGGEGVLKKVEESFLQNLCLTNVQGNEACLLLLNCSELVMVPTVTVQLFSVVLPICKSLAILD